MNDANDAGSKRKLVRFTGGKYQFKVIKNTNENIKRKQRSARNIQSQTDE